MNTYTLQRPGVEITCVESVSRGVAQHWMDEHRGWFDDPGPNARERQARLARLPLERGDAIVKRDALPFSAGALLAVAGRSTRSRRAFEIGLHLARKGVRAARPLALIEERRSGLIRISCLVLEAIEATPLRAFILSRQLDTGEKRKLSRAIAAEVAKLHAANVQQRDLKAPNILVAETGHGDLEIHLIDLEGMRLLASSPSYRVRLRDIARLVVSLREASVAAAGVDADDLRFLVRSYLELTSGTPPVEKEVDRFLSGALRWARKKEARNLRHDRAIH
jgi:tRNA A-37 threonylcarbamoyl transferase component Bud32